MARFLYIVVVLLSLCSCNKDIAKHGKVLAAAPPVYEPEFFTGGIIAGGGDMFEVCFFFTEMRGDTLFWEEGRVKFSDKMLLPAISLKNDVK